MSEQEGPQGVQGEQGVRGLQGPTGEGEVGEQGVQGIQGKAGPLETQVKTAFGIVVLVAILISTAQWFAFQEVSDVSDENRRIIARLEVSEAQALKDHAALCSFRADLQRRVRNSREFLADVEAMRRPPIDGISSNDLRRSIDGQQATLDSLKVDCEP